MNLLEARATSWSVAKLLKKLHDGHRVGFFEHDNPGKSFHWIARVPGEIVAKGNVRGTQLVGGSWELYFEGSIICIEEDSCFDDFVIAMRLKTAKVSWDKYTAMSSTIEAALISPLFTRWEKRKLLAFKKELEGLLAQFIETKEEVLQ